MLVKASNINNLRWDKAYSFQNEDNDDSGPHDCNENNIPEEYFLLWSARIDQRLSELERCHHEGIVGEEHILDLNIAGAHFGVHDAHGVV